jgi:hypothetical protein
VLEKASLPAPGAVANAQTTEVNAPMPAKRWSRRHAYQELGKTHRELTPHLGRLVKARVQVARRSVGAYRSPGLICTERLCAVSMLTPASPQILGERFSRLQLLGRRVRNPLVFAKPTR